MPVCVFVFCGRVYIKCTVGARYTRLGTLTVHPLVKRGGACKHIKYINHSGKGEALVCAKEQLNVYIRDSSNTYAYMFPRAGYGMHTHVCFMIQGR